MKEHNLIRKIQQYGYDTDVFDKYRDAVARHNRNALQVLSIVGIVTALGCMAAAVAKSHWGGVAAALLLLAAAVAGAVVSRMKELKPKTILIAGYVLCCSFYALSIYGVSAYNHPSFWVGVNMAMSCYLLDYAARLFSMQGVSFLAVMIALDQRKTAGSADPLGEWYLYFIFLAAGIITMYMLGNVRIGLIMSREVTKQQADTDLLTGLTIRKAAQLDIEEHLASSEESGVLMLLDLDRFKSVNDRLGHQMGDKVLIDVAADLKKMFRNSDVLSRLGGDEFIIYMKAVPEHDWAVQRAEQVVRAVRRWVGDGTTNIQVTASVGVVMTETVERNYDDLYRAADIAMYFSKAQGGNSAIFYSRDLLNQARGAAAPREEGTPEARTVAEHNETSRDGDDLR